MNKKLLFGVGINDANYTTQPTIDGKVTVCPYYRKWTSMLRRCYSDRVHALNPTYIGCSVDPEWHSFMAFKSWMEKQDWEGMQLDKDILVVGNKIYGPDFCVFVDSKTNNLLLDSSASRGGLPIGVNRSGGKFQALCCEDGKQKSIGTYKTIEEAHSAYVEFKAGVVMSCALRQVDEKVQDALFIRSLVMAATLQNRNNEASK